MKSIIITFLLTTALFAELKKGEPFPTLNLVDQFDEKIEIGQENNTTLLISFEKDISKKINAFLKEKKPEFMKNHNLLYISDISSMPSFVTSWFALPKMKELPFKIALIYEEEVAESINKEEGKISVINLRNNHVESIKFVEPNSLKNLFH